MENHHTLSAGSVVLVFVRPALVVARMWQANTDPHWLR